MVWYNCWVWIDAHSYFTNSLLTTFFGNIFCAPSLVAIIWGRYDSSKFQWVGIGFGALSSMIYVILFWILILLTQIIYLSAWSFWHLTIGISCAYYADKTCHWFPAIDNNPLVPPENYTHMYTGISYLLPNANVLSR